MVALGNAQAARATAAIIFDGGPGAPTSSTARSEVRLSRSPFLTTFAVGEELYTLDGQSGASVHILTQPVSETRTTPNVIANTPSCRTDRVVVVVGAHVDSVAE